MYTKKITEILYTMREDFGVETEEYLYYKKVTDSLVIVTRTNKKTMDTKIILTVEKKRLAHRPLLTMNEIVEIFFEYPLIKAIGKYSREFNSAHDVLTVFRDVDIIAVVCTDE